MDGVLNLLKPPGMTSHDAVAYARRVLKIKRIGHTGTLDPAAAGVLPLCIGQATRLVEYLQSGTKEYIAEMTFGSETDSGDVLGNIVARGDASTLDLEVLRRALDGFRGEITQTPPLHSAIKVGGQKLYDLARAGKTDEEIEIPTREVTISGLVVTRFWNDENGVRAIVKIECSGGTYIRSLVRDIGRVLGCRATMTFLVRTRSGGFDIDGASTLEELASANTSILFPIIEVLPWCADDTIEDDAAIQAFAHGKQIALASNAARVLVWNHARTVAALVSPAGSDCNKNYKPDKVFFLNPEARTS